MTQLICRCDVIIKNNELIINFLVFKLNVQICTFIAVLMNFVSYYFILKKTIKLNLLFKYDYFYFIFLQATNFFISHDKIIFNEHVYINLTEILFLNDFSIYTSGFWFIYLLVCKIITLFYRVNIAIECFEFYWQN